MVDTDVLEQRIAALEAQMQRYLMGDRPLVCKYCRTVYQWLTADERGLAVYRHHVCNDNECRLKLMEERRAERERKEQWEAQQKAEDEARRAANLAAGLRANGLPKRKERHRR